MFIRWWTCRNNNSCYIYINECLFWPDASKYHHPVSPLWILVFSRTCWHFVRSLTMSLYLLMLGGFGLSQLHPTPSNYLSRGRPLVLLPAGVSVIDFLIMLLPGIRIRCPTHRNIKKVPFHGNEIRQKTLSFYADLQSNATSWCDGWFNRFKSRFNLKHIKITVESVLKNRIFVPSF